MELGKGESKPTPGNPEGYSRRQIMVLNFFRDRDSENKIRNSNYDENFSSWCGNSMNAYTVNKNDTHTKGMSFKMFSPVQESSSKTKIYDSSAMRCTIKHLKEIKERSKGDNSVIVSSEAMHIFTILNSIGGSVCH